MNVSKYIPKQIHLPYIGAIYELSGRTIFILNLANLVLNTRIYFYNPGDSYLRDILASYLVFMSAAFSFAILSMTFMWVFVVPSHMKFNNDQRVANGIDPTFEKVCELVYIFKVKG